MEVMPAQKKSARKHQGAPLFFKRNGESSFFRASANRGLTEGTPFDLLPSREEETSGNEKDLPQSGEQSMSSPVSTCPTGAYSSATQGVGGSTGNEDEISPETDEEKETEQEMEPEGSSALIQGASGDPDDQDHRERRESGNSVNFSENPQPSHSGLPSGRKTSPVSNAVKRGNSDSGDTLRSMEESFGRDFSDVRLHTDPEAVALNRRLGSQAFTYGKDIYFNEGKLNPATTEGKHLLAHELTHTIQQGETSASGKDSASPSIAKTGKKMVQAVPAITGINVPAEIGVGRNIRASVVLAPGTARRTALTWSLVGAPAGVTAGTNGRQITIRASQASEASAGNNFQVRCQLTSNPADSFTSANILLVGISRVTFTAAPAFANQGTFAGAATAAFPVNTADPNRDGVAGNTANVNIVTAPPGRAATVSMRRALGAVAAANIVTPASQTGTAVVRVTDDATQAFKDENLVINPVPLNLRRFTAQFAAGPYGALNSIAWTSSDRTGTLDRVVGETITAGGRDDFGYTATINTTGPNAAPVPALSAQANNWHDNLLTSAGASAGAAGNANMLNVNRYVGPGVANRLPRIWILRQGFHWQSWTGAWSTEFDHGTHRRSLRRNRTQPSGFGFRTEHRFPRANARVRNENYVGMPLINLRNITLTPLAPLADGGLAADGVATASVRMNTNVPGRTVNWTVPRGSSGFTAGHIAGPVGGAATLRAAATRERFRLRAADSFFVNRRTERSFRLQSVRLRRLRAVNRNVPAGTLMTIVNLFADPGGRTVNWTLDAAANAAGVVVVPMPFVPNVRARRAMVTRPADFTGTVTVTAADTVLPAVTNSTRVRFR